MSRHLFLLGRSHARRLTHLAVLLLDRSPASHRATKRWVGWTAHPEEETETALLPPSRPGEPPLPVPTLSMDTGVPVRGTRKARTLGHAARERHRQTPDHLSREVTP